MVIKLFAFKIPPFKLVISEIMHFRKFATKVRRLTPSSFSSRMHSKLILGVTGMEFISAIC